MKGLQKADAGGEFRISTCKDNSGRANLVRDGANPTDVTAGFQCPAQCRAPFNAVASKHRNESNRHRRAGARAVAEMILPDRGKDWQFNVFDGMTRD